MPASVSHASLEKILRDRAERHAASGLPDRRQREVPNGVFLRGSPAEHRALAEETPLDMRYREYEGLDRQEDDYLPTWRECIPGALICLAAVGVLVAVAIYMLIKAST